MHKITKVPSDVLNIYEVAHEPGDLTHYSYLVLVDVDEYSFMPYRSTLKFPQRLNWYETQFNNEEKKQAAITSLAKKWDCNPWTIRSCIASMKKIRLQ